MPIKWSNFYNRFLITFGKPPLPASYVCVFLLLINPLRTAAVILRLNQALLESPHIRNIMSKSIGSKKGAITLQQMKLSGRNKDHFICHS